MGCSCESWPLVYRLNLGFSSNVFYFFGAMACSFCSGLIKQSKDLARLVSRERHVSINKPT